MKYLLVGLLFVIVLTARAHKNKGDHERINAERGTSIQVLAIKLRANTITVAEEKDELLDKMLQHMGF